MIGLLSVSVGIPTGGQKENALASSAHTCADMQAKCSGYNNIMMFCCKQAEGREANDAMCARFAENAVICGGSEHMEATMQSCCASEWTDGATLQDIRVRKQRLGVHGVIGDDEDAAPIMVVGEEGEMEELHAEVVPEGHQRVLQVSAAAAS